MKKQFQILAATFITVALISCSKETITDPQPTGPGEIPVGKPGGTVDPLTVNLEGWFTFDNNVNDKAGKLADPISTTGAVKYGANRKGKGKSAIHLDGYSLKIKNVPQQTHMSMSFWFKSETFVQLYSKDMIDALGSGFHVAQPIQGAEGSIVIGPNSKISSRWFNSSEWNLFTMTYDGQSLTTWVNGLPQSAYFAGFIIPHLTDFVLGGNHGGEKWYGYLDDVRFYSRTLTQSDIYKIFNQ